MSVPGPGSNSHDLLEEASAIVRSDPAIAQQLAEQVLMQEPWNTSALSLAGTAASDSGDFSAAIEHLSEARIVEPDNARHHYDLGVVLVRIKDAFQACSAFEAAVSLVPDHRDAIFNLAIVYGLIGDMASALVAYTRVVQLGVAESREEQLREALGAIAANREDGWGLERAPESEASGPHAPALASRSMPELITLAASDELEGSPGVVREIIDHVLERFLLEQRASVILQQWRAQTQLQEYGVSAYLRGLAARVATLPCVRALVPQPSFQGSRVIEAGMFKDVEAQLRALLSMLLGRDVSEAMGLLQRGKRSWKWVAFLGDHSYEISWSGNAFHLSCEAEGLERDYIDHEGRFRAPTLL
jgi:tetratricopeptide (TPR) repeat protein